MTFRGLLDNAGRGIAHPRHTPEEKRDAGAGRESPGQEQKREHEVAVLLLQHADNSRSGEPAKIADGVDEGKSCRGAVPVRMAVGSDQNVPIASIDAKCREGQGEHRERKVQRHRRPGEGGGAGQKRERDMPDAFAGRIRMRTGQHHSDAGKGRRNGGEKAAVVEEEKRDDTKRYSGQSLDNEEPLPAFSPPKPCILSRAPEIGPPTIVATGTAAMNSETIRARSRVGNQ
jgi:hypothetical protein